MTVKQALFVVGLTALAVGLSAYLCLVLIPDMFTLVRIP